MSCVGCHMSDFFFDKVVGLDDGGSVINGAYPVYFHHYHDFKAKTLKVLDTPLSGTVNEGFGRSLAGRVRVFSIGPAIMGVVR